MSDRQPNGDDPRVEWTDAERAALERLRTARPPADLEKDVIAALAGRGLIGGTGGGSGAGPGGTGAPRVPRRRVLGWAGLAAAACLAAFLAGRAVSERGAGVGTDAGSRTYVLLLYEDASYRGSSTPEEHAARVAEYAAWADDLGERGIAIDGEELAPAEGGAWLASRAGEVVATVGAPVGPAGALTGFFLFEAPSAVAAAEIARTVPHLAHGGTVVVRGIVEH